ncbi:MAG: FliG C-terminal domain-containing protein [Pseudomonadota bacterium]
MTLPVRTSSPSDPKGLQRSALLMRALGAKASHVWAQLSPQEAAKLTETMQTLPEDPMGEQSALQSYVDAMQSAPPRNAAAQGSVWDKLAALEGAVIIDLIQNESPQVIALMLSRLPPEGAANAVRAMPRSLATDALKRLLNLGEVHPGALKALELSLEKSLTPIIASGATGGHEHIARIFDRLDSHSEQVLLSSLDGAEPGAGEKIRALMFTFEDLANLDPASLQTIIGNVDRAVLTLALKGADEDVSDAFFQNLTQRAGELLREEIATSGPVRRSEIEAARNELLTLARTLANRGDILTRDADDELVE